MSYDNVGFEKWDSIDVVAEENGHMVLSIFTIDEWGDHVNMAELRVKIKHKLVYYLDAIESGFLHEKYPQFKDLPIKITIFHASPVPQEVLTLIQFIQSRLLTPRNIKVEYIYEAGMTL